MAAIGVKHANCVRNVNMLLTRLVPGGLAVDVQNPIRVGHDGEPLPDLAVIHDRDYLTTPSEKDVLFVVEVSDSTIAYDRGTKLPLYASAGIPETWLVDVNAGVLGQHTQPRDGTYQHISFARTGESLASTIVPPITIPVADILR